MFSYTSFMFSLLLLFASLCAPALAHYGGQWPNNGPSYGYGSGCKEILQRREWRTLSDVEKKDYIDAVKCLMTHPAQNPPMPEAKTRFDEFQSFHIVMADRVHLTGSFLPWHRHLVRSYEIALRSECGYQGANPYWDWTQDSDSNKTLANAPVFDPVTGFGGNGVVDTYTVPVDTLNTSRIFPTFFQGCVQDGPFANYTLRLGPGKLVTDHCLVRGINDGEKQFMDSSAVARLTSITNYEQFHIELEGEPITPDHRVHDGGHLAIGGEMSNFYSSPGDPLFYLHHANLDRIWWNWQQMLPSRKYEMTGRSTITPPFYNVTLDYLLQMGSLGPNVPIGDVMDILSEKNCYTYV